MKKFITIALIALILYTPALIARETITSAELTIKSAGELKIEKFFENGEAGINVTNAKGEVLLNRDKLGTADKKFMLDGKPVTLAFKDITGNGVPEILTAFYSGYKSSCLYIFTYDEKENRFNAIDFANDTDPELSTDFVPSDIYQESGSDIVVNDDGSLAILGTIYPDKAGEEARAGIYTFKFKENSCRLISTVPVPEE